MSLVLNGSGTITGLSAGGLPDSSVTTAELADAAVTQAKLGTNVAGNGPAFSAYRNASQSFTANTNVKVQFNTELFDTNSNYDKDTNYRFLPTVAGYYQINAYITVSGTFSGAATYTNLYLWKNGSQVAVGGTQPGNNNYSMMVLSSLQYMNGSTDYVEIYTASGVATTLVDSQAWNGFSASLVRVA